MVSAEFPPPQTPIDAVVERRAPEKGLKGGALGLVSTTVIGVASTAPAYSLAATLGFIVALVGLQSPLIVALAFVPAFLVAMGYKELNKADPDCGTTFTWATRAFGPKTGWMGGWGIVAADVLVMASLAQVAGQYVFLLFNAHGIGENATSGWVLTVGVLFIVLMTWICYRGIELSARIQTALLGLEASMLVVMSVVALIRFGTGHAPKGASGAKLSWFNPTHLPSFSVFVSAMLLMLFIYWGWDSAVSVNEETKDSTRTPGRAAVISTILLVLIYVLVTVSAQMFAGVGETGIGLGNPDNSNDVLSVLGGAIFGTSWFGSLLTHLLILMVLSSAAASTQTTILPTARTTLSMGVYRALPSSFAKMHPKYLIPTVSTLAMGGISIVLYLVANFASHGNVIADSVTACGVCIGFYYGLTGLACFWFYRKTLLHSAHNFFIRGLLPLLGGLMLFFALAWSAKDDWNWEGGDGASYTSWTMPFSPHWQIGGVFLLGFGSLLLGVILMIVWRLFSPAFFKGETLNRDSPTLVPDVGDAELAAALAATHS
ncbi:MAG TPA: APC family permease [Frankiaceae bacterium]|nr:APC family permease [Frankiaceae bacterium]